MEKNSECSGPLNAFMDKIKNAKLAQMEIEQAKAKLPKIIEVRKDFQDRPHSLFKLLYGLLNHTPLPHIIALESENPGYATSTFLKYFPEDEKFTPIKQALQETVSLGNLNKSGRLTRCKILEHIQKLGKSKSNTVLLDGGSRGHAMIYRVTWNRDKENYDVTIINSGTMVPPINKLNYLHDVRYTDVDFEQLSALFTKKLTRRYWEYTTADIYQIFHTTLGKKNDNGEVENYIQGRVHQHQGDRGTCAYLSTRQAIHDVFFTTDIASRWEYKQALLSHVLATAKDYCAENMNNPKWRLAVFGVESFEEADTIKNQMFSEAEKLLTKYSTRLAAYEVALPNDVSGK